MRQPTATETAGLRPSGPSVEPHPTPARPASGAVLGLFEAPEAVADALEALRRAEVADADLEVLSDAPYPEGAFGEAPVRHRLYLFPLVGAACGLAVGLLIAFGTQLSYPLVTGGQPILALPPMINIVFIGTMLGAIVLTTIGILFEARLPDLAAAPYDPRISEGYLGVLVRRTADAARVEGMLRQAGAVDVVVQGSAQHGG